MHGLREKAGSGERPCSRRMHGLVRGHGRLRGEALQLCKAAACMALGAWQGGSWPRVRAVSDCQPPGEALRGTGLVGPKSVR